VLVYNVQLAAQEIYTNITTHAYAEQSEGRISVTLTLEHPPRRLIIDLRDTGLSFKPSDVPAPNLDVVQTQGYGLFLTRQLMDEVNYYPQNGNNRWRLVKNL
jgi:serine/threonine-protein kinase RsbW